MAMSSVNNFPIYFLSYESITIHTVESYILATDTRYKLCIYSSKYIAGDSKIIFSKIINGTYENFNNAHIRK